MKNRASAEKEQRKKERERERERKTERQTKKKKHACEQTTALFTRERELGGNFARG